MEARFAFGLERIKSSVTAGGCQLFLLARDTSARERKKEGASSIRRVMLVSHELAQVFAEISIGFVCKACSIDVASSEIKEREKETRKWQWG